MTFQKCILIVGPPTTVTSEDFSFPMSLITNLLYVKDVIWSESFATSTNKKHKFVVDRELSSKKVTHNLHGNNCDKHNRIAGTFPKVDVWQLFVGPVAGVPGSFRYSNKN